MKSYNDYVGKLSRRVEARLTDIEAIFNFDFGDEFEVAICTLLQDLLPAKFGVCRGFVVTEDGECRGDDLIIYDKLSAPTLRSSIGMQYSVKEQIPVEAVYAYIECKHAIKKDDVMQTAVDQCNSVKKLLLTRSPRTNPSYEAEGPIYNNKVRNWPRAYPPLKNQPFTAVFSREYDVEVNVPKSQDGLSPDLMILGSHHIASHSHLLGPDGIKSALFHDAAWGSFLRVEKAEARAFGLGLVILLQALGWIELSQIDWAHTLNHEFNEITFGKK